MDDQDIAITTTIKGEAGSIVLIPVEGPRPPDWASGYTEHKLGYAIRAYAHAYGSAFIVGRDPLPVTGGAITAVKGRLDFDMPEAPDDKDALTEMLNAIIARNFDITERWISDAELDANPDL